MGLVGLVGATAVGVGSVLEWWSVAGATLTAWDITIGFLATGHASRGLKAGPVLLGVALLLVLVLVALSWLTGRQLPPVVPFAVALVVLAIALAALIRGLRESPSINPGVGLLLTLGGGLLIVLESFPRVSPRGASE
jgi:hypothetical protein